MIADISKRCRQISPLYPATYNDNRISQNDRLCQMETAGTWPPPDAPVQIIQGVPVCVRLLKDAAYSASPTTSKAYPRPKRGEPPHAFNIQIYDKVYASGRQCVENMFGDATNRFRILKGNLEMGGSQWEYRLRNIIRAAMVLHNLCLDDDDSAGDFSHTSDSSSSSSVLSFDDVDSDDDGPQTNAAVQNAIVLYLQTRFELHGHSYRAIQR